MHFPLLPKHLGIIIDGNRRWARLRGLKPWEGHWHGAQKLEQFLKWWYELNIPEVSVYTLSTENLSRPKCELRELFRIFMHYLQRWENKESDFLERYRVRVKFVGDLERLPKPLLRLMFKLMQRTAKHQRRILNVLIAYGGKFELMQAIKYLVERALKRGWIELSERTLEQCLLITSPLDLIIRTGGMQRLSNFMLWQAAYAEFYVTPTLWPDFSKREFLQILRWYSRVERKFGK